MPTQAAVRRPGAFGRRAGGLPRARARRPARPEDRPEGRPPLASPLLLLVLVVPALAVLLLAPVPSARAGGPGDPARPGAYCPLPEPGHTPVCLDPAQATYGEFFAAIGRGQVPGDAARAVEADLRGGSGTERAYLALSSISYGYYRLAEQLRARDDVDPAVQARLTQWNQLLVSLYGTTDPDDPFRAAVREAAADIRSRTPGDGAHCPNRYPGGCRHSEDLVRALAAIDDTAGVRSPLGNLLRRLFGEAPEAPTTAEAASR